MNKQKADNLSDVTPWPHFIFRAAYFFSPFFVLLLGKVVSLSRETLHVSSKRFSCCDAQTPVCVWATRYHVQPCLWHSHLRSNRGGAQRGWRVFYFLFLFFASASTPVTLTVGTLGQFPLRWTSHRFIYLLSTGTERTFWDGANSGSQQSCCLAVHHGVKSEKGNDSK